MEVALERHDHLLAEVIEGHGGAPGLPGAEQALELR